MIKYGNILIKNIYYMLSYAFQNLNFICGESIKTENFENIQDLLATILCRGINTQLKRGIYKEYEEKEEALSCIKGKIIFTKSISQSTMIDKKLVCNFDEFTENTYINQVLKSTCELLISKSDIKLQNKKLLKKVLLYFSRVDSIDVKRINWSRITYHRNNITYKTLINICYLIIKGLISTTESGELKFNRYLDDQYMHYLYEKFILEFYKKHFPQLNPGSKCIDWNIMDSNEIEFLPKMQSDIMLEHNGKTLIIDAKFYKHSMQERFEKKSFISGNLYQIYTYVKNKDVTHSGNVSGLLLYAKTDEEQIPDNEYIFDNNKIGIKTLDLNTDWINIKNKLIDIAQTIIEQE